MVGWVGVVRAGLVGALSVVLVAPGVGAFGAPVSVEPELSVVSGSAEVDVAALTTEGLVPEVELFSGEAKLFAADAEAAMSLARASGHVVEDVSQRTPSSSTFALPSGFFQVRAYAGTFWVQVAGDGTQPGHWRVYDATLIEDAGVVRPKHHPGDTWLSAGGDTGVVFQYEFVDSGVTVQVVSEVEVLPSPVLEGPRATYREYFPGIDLVFEVFAEGYEQFYVAHTPAALERAGELGFTTRVTGGELVEDADGRVVVVDEGGTVVASAPTAFAWDAAEDAKRAHPLLEEWSEDINLSDGLRVGGAVLPQQVADGA